ncbi:MAG: hypothetical protein ACXWT3_13535 [Methylococcaceae bacterium]
MNQAGEIISVLNEINTNLSIIAQSLANDSFINSQWFSALIGAGSAIFIVIIEKYISWRKRENERLLDFCKWLNEQWPFRSPDTLLKAARSTVYGHEERNSKTGEVKVVPEKPLGEKMVIELRRDLKWWREPNRTLNKYFKKYEELLSKFDQLHEADSTLEKQLIDEAMKYYEKIDAYAFKVTGDNEHTAI